MTSEAVRHKALISHLFKPYDILNDLEGWLKYSTIAAACRSLPPVDRLSDLPFLNVVGLLLLDARNGDTDMRRKD